jgi:hypothetical protein
MQSQLQLEEDLGANPFANSLQEVLSKHQIDLPHMATILPALKQSNWLPVDDALPQSYHHNQHFQSNYHQRSSPPFSPDSSNTPPSHSGPPSPQPSSSSSSAMKQLRSPASQARMFLEGNDDDTNSVASSSSSNFLKKKSSKASMNSPNRDDVKFNFLSPSSSNGSSFTLNNGRGRADARNDPSRAEARGTSLSRLPSEYSNNTSSSGGGGGGRGSSRTRSGSDAPYQQQQQQQRGSSLGRRTSDAGDLAGLDQIVGATKGVFLGQQGRVKSASLYETLDGDISGRKSPMAPSSPNISSQTPTRGLKSVRELFPPALSPLAPVVNTSGTTSTASSSSVAGTSVNVSSPSPASLLKDKKLESKKSLLNMLNNKKDKSDKKKEKDNKKNSKKKGEVGSEWDDDGDISDGDRESSKKKSGGMDMSSFAAAALAATLPATLPPIPAESVGNVGEETCVWLNAFLGRIYRDAARSPHYHLWFAARIEESLNKGWANRPDFVDEMKV